jgi:hypothetical protein
MTELSEERAWVSEAGGVGDLVERLERRIRALENMVGAGGVVVTRTPDGVTIAAERKDAETWPDQMPPGDVESQTLNWDNTNKVWYAGPLRMM